MQEARCPHGWRASIDEGRYMVEGAQNAWLVLVQVGGCAGFRGGFIDGGHDAGSGVRGGHLRSGSRGSPSGNVCRDTCFVG